MAIMINSLCTWNMIDKYGIKGVQTIDNASLVVPKSEYLKVLADNDSIQSLCMAMID